jgi:hypothetical protein
MIETWSILQKGDGTKQGTPPKKHRTNDLTRAATASSVGQVAAD